MKLGVYDSTRRQQGNKLAETGDIVTPVGWNVDSVTPVSFNAGKYWLAYLTSDNNIHFGITSHMPQPLTSATRSSLLCDLDEQRQFVADCIYQRLTDQY